MDARQSLQQLFLIAALLLSVPQNEDNFMYTDIKLAPSFFKFPENSYWATVPADNRETDIWPLSSKIDHIEFKKNISRSSPITIHFTIERLVDPWHKLWRWERIFTGSQLLCSPEKLNSSVGTLVRRVLGIPEGCPIKAGEKRDTSKLEIPMKMKNLYLDVGTIQHRIRILTTVYDVMILPSETLFSGDFYPEYPIKGSYVSGERRELIRP